MRKKLSLALLAISLVLPVLPADANHDHDTSYFKPSRFEDPLDIDNEYYPLEPGTRLVLEGVEVDAGKTLNRKLEITVSGVVKKIRGVKARAVSERDYIATQSGAVPSFVREDELTFLAQDRRDNVWRMAEYAEEFDFELPQQRFYVGAPNTWIAGREGAIPGLYMRGRPETDTPPYSQIFAPYAGGKPGMDDQAEVIEDALHICLGNGNCYDDVIVVREQNIRQENDCCQLKYHAPGVGNIKVEAVDVNGDPSDGEFLELVRVEHLSPTELAQVNRDVLALDARAYDIETPDESLHAFPAFAEAPVPYLERLVAGLWYGSHRAYLP